MQSARKFVAVLVTTPNAATARKLSRRALEARLVACGNLIPRIESHYWWQGQIERSSEVLILFKTALPLLGRLEKLILAHHPYETPEIIALPLAKGTRRYLRWIDENVK